MSNSFFINKEHFIVLSILKEGFAFSKSEISKINNILKLNEILAQLKFNNLIECSSDFWNKTELGITYEKAVNLILEILEKGNYKNIQILQNQLNNKKVYLNLKQIEDICEYLTRSKKLSKVVMEFYKKI